jgi:hypothetical protein
MSLIDHFPSVNSGSSDRHFDRGPQRCSNNRSHLPTREVSELTIMLLFRGGRCARRVAADSRNMKITNGSHRHCVLREIDHHSVSFAIMKRVLKILCVILEAWGGAVDGNNQERIKYVGQKHIGTLK